MQSCHSFALPTFAKYFHAITDAKQLPEVFRQLVPEVPIWILGEGSNCIFTDNYQGQVLHIANKGIAIADCGEFYSVNAQAGENWHKLVAHLIESGIYGLENLALIPGTVGACPVQNIGAYGVEIERFINCVKYYSIEHKEFIELNKLECDFAYRDSIFKHELYGKAVITEVEFHFPKLWRPVLKYGELKALPADVTAAQIMAKVIEIRNAKIPLPHLVPNAGSFFKNPVVPMHFADELIKSYPDMPCYRVDDSHIKLAAGWLIDQCGLKGKTYGGAAVHKQQALILLNNAGATGTDLLELARNVRQSVYNRFGVELEAEVRLLGSQGEIFLPGIKQQLRTGKQ